jgi:hypothetical protein
LIDCAAKIEEFVQSAKWEKQKDKNHPDEKGDRNEERRHQESFLILIPIKTSKNAPGSAKFKWNAALTAAFAKRSPRFDLERRKI